MAVISGAWLNSNHSHALLKGANLSNIDGDSLNFSAAYITNANLSGANLMRANFSEADLTGTHLDGALLLNSNFFGAKGLDLTNALVCNIILPDGKMSLCDKRMVGW